ncbi:MAG: hypothetical protein SFW35_05370 [Chitinophagales bacterium]|nr:hypothetical protein [Chitinophagales bacterium]
MTPRLSKAVLTSHITVSVGWFGAVAVFIVLAVAGLTAQENQLARSAYVAMELSAWYVIVPFCIASLLTGVIQATGTKWGVFKFYWIVVKLFLTVALTILLLLHMQPIEYLAGVAADANFSNANNSGRVINLIAKAGAALTALLFITTVSVYKPWGKINMLPYAGTQNGKVQLGKRWSSYALFGLIVLIVIFIITHLLGGGMPKH